MPFKSFWLLGILGIVLAVGLAAGRSSLFRSPSPEIIIATPAASRIVAGENLPLPPGGGVLLETIAQ